MARASLPRRTLVVLLVLVSVFLFVVYHLARRWYANWKPRWESAKLRVLEQNRATQANAGAGSAEAEAGAQEQVTVAVASAPTPPSSALQQQSAAPNRPQSEVDLAAEAGLVEADDDSYEASLNLARAASLRTAEDATASQTQPTVPTAPQQASRPDIPRDDVPHDYRCPITLELMEDPVVASDGFSYERVAITAWLRGRHPTSPVTGARMDRSDVVPNHTLKAAIESFVDSYRTGAVVASNQGV